VIPTLDTYAEGPERQIASELVNTILECEAPDYEMNSAQAIVEHVCDRMRTAGWLYLWRRDFLTRLHNDLTALTGGHLATRRILKFIEDGYVLDSGRPKI